MTVVLDWEVVFEALCGEGAEAFGTAEAPVGVAGLGGLAGGS